MKRLKICENRLEAETIIHELNKQKIVALMKSYTGIEPEHQDKLEVLVNPDDLEKSQKIVEGLEAA